MKTFKLFLGLALMIFSIYWSFVIDIATGGVLFAVAGTISDIDFQGEVFRGYLDALIPDRTEFLTQGILVNANNSYIAQQTGEFANIPRYDKLAGDFERIQANTPASVGNHGTSADRGVWLELVKVWGVEDWTKWITGADLEGSIAKQIANWTARQLQIIGMKVLAGVFDTALASSHSTGATYAAETINEINVGQTKLLLGDNAYRLQKGLMNSKVLEDAVQRKIAEYDTQGETFQSGRLATMMGMGISSDDNITSTLDVYPTYLAEPGTMIYQFRKGPSVTVFRDELLAAGTEMIKVVASVVVHLPGVKYNSATANPTNNQLATGSNWTKVYEDKAIPIVQLKTL